MIQKEQTKHEIREQNEKIASMKADICMETNGIGHKILRWVNALDSTGWLPCRPRCVGGGSRNVICICRHVLSDNKVPTDAFKGAKGVLLLQAAFAAAGVTGARGEGFVVVNNGGTWSAPAFVRLSTVGLGFSLGGGLECARCGHAGMRSAAVCMGLPCSDTSFSWIAGEMVDTIAVLYRDEDVESYKKGDFGIQPYRADLHIPANHGVGEKEAHPAVFSSHSGAMIDFSISSALAQPNSYLRMHTSHTGWCLVT